MNLKTDTLWTNVKADLCGFPECAEDAELFSICERGLGEFAARSERYRASVHTAKPFMDELEQMLQRLELRAMALEGQRQEVAFGLVEALTMIMRETVLRTGGEFSEAEKDVLRFFETSGRWTPMDGTLVSDYYYVRIPISVMLEFANQKTGAAL